MKSQASSVSSVSGTTSSAEKQAARPMLSVPWPVKYQWWPVPTMPAPQVEDGVEVDDARGRAWRVTRPIWTEHHRDEHGGEELEEALDPQVDDPEAPVVDHGEVGVRAVEQRGQVEERDRRRGVEEERRELGPPADRGSPGAARGT